jgi:hypothetical protein
MTVKSDLVVFRLVNWWCLMLQEVEVLVLSRQQRWSRCLLLGLLLRVGVKSVLRHMLTG